jgi:O-antigen ligase
MLFNVQALEGYYRHERLTSHYGIGLMGEVSPLTVAAYFSIMSFLAYSFYLFYSRRLLTKLFFLMAGLSFTVCSILSGEKIALLFFGVCIAVLSCLDFRKMKGLIVGIAMMIVLMIIVKSFIEGTSYAHVDRVFQVRGYIDGIWDRINNVAWGSFIYVGVQHFFTGVGKGGFHQIYEEAHNQYIKVFFESGVFGLISFVFLLGAAGSMCVKVFRQTRDEMGKVISSAALCCLVGLSIAAIVQDAFKPVLPSELFWIFMGMTAAIYGIETNYSGSLVSGDDNGKRRK